MAIAVKGATVVVLVTGIGIAAAAMHRSGPGPGSGDRPVHVRRRWRALVAATIVAVAVGCVVWWPEPDTDAALSKWITVVFLVAVAAWVAVRRWGPRPASMRSGLVVLLSSAAVLELVLTRWP